MIEVWVEVATFFCEKSMIGNMSLYLLRHGRTDWNASGTIQGRFDVPLNDEGKEQARLAGEKLKDIALTRCYCSPLIRARETAEIALKGRNIPFFFDDRLVEMAYGDFEGKNWKDPRYQYLRRQLSYRYPKGESYLDVAHRAFSFLEEIRPYAEKEDILIVCHGGIARAIDAYFVGEETNDSFIDKICPNGAIRKYDYVDRYLPPVMPLPKK